MLKIIGYGDKLSIAPGETIRFMVSAYDGQPYRARIVRLIHGDANPEGPGFKCEPVAGGIEAAHVGRPQAIRCGSWAKVPHRARLRELKSFTVAAMIMPTTPGKGRQGLVGHWDEGGLAGWLLEIDGQGCLAARVGDGRAAVEVGTGAPLHRGHWYLAAMTYDAGTGRLAVVQRPVARLGVVSDAGAGTQTAPGFRVPETDIVMAAVLAKAAAWGITTTGGSTARACSTVRCRPSGWKRSSCGRCRPTLPGRWWPPGTSAGTWRR